MEALQNEQIRVSIDDRHGNKICETQMKKILYILVLSNKEMDRQHVTVP